MFYNPYCALTRKLSTWNSLVWGAFIQLWEIISIFSFRCDFDLQLFYYCYHSYLLKPVLKPRKLLAQWRIEVRVYMKTTKVKFCQKQEEKLGRQWPGSWFDQPSKVELEEKMHNKSQLYFSFTYFAIVIAHSAL